MYAVDKSSDILENILEKAGATLGTRNLGSGRTISTIQVQEIRPPEEALQNDFQVCQGRVAEYAGDTFADTR